MKIQELRCLCVICMIVLLNGCQAVGDEFVNSVLESSAKVDPSNFTVPECPEFDEEEQEIIQLICWEDCGYYWRCIGDIPYLQECPPGLLYNEVLGVCDFPWMMNTDRCK